MKPNLKLIFISAYIFLFLNAAVFIYSENEKDLTDDKCFIDLTDRTEYELTESDIEKKAKIDIEAIVKNDKEKIKRNEKTDTEERDIKIYKILKFWFDNDIISKFIIALQSHNKLNDAVHSYLRFRKFAQTFGIDEKFMDEHDSIRDKLIVIIKNIIPEEIEKCRSNKDPTRLGRIIQLLNFVDMIGCDNYKGFSKASYYEELLALGNFELRIKTKFIHKIKLITDSEVKTTYHIAIGKGDVSLITLDEIRGLGKVEITENFFVDRYLSPAPKHEEWFFKVYKTKIITDNYKTFKMNIPIYFFNHTEVKYIDNKTDFEFESPIWDFLNMHIEEALKIPTWEYYSSQLNASNILTKTEKELEKLMEEINTVKVKDWELVNKNGLYARKEYYRTKYPLGMGPYPEKFGHLPRIEETTLELVFKPK